MEGDNNEVIKTNITEPILNTNIIGGTFEIGILNKKGKIEFSTIIFDKSQKIIFLKTKDNIEIKINYDDVISFTKDESSKLKKIQEENSDLNKSKISQLNIRFESF